MAIITISRGSYSRGNQVAGLVAERLGYEAIAREVLLEASEQFNIPEIYLVRAIRNSPSILERFRHGKERYIAYIRAALLRHLRRDNVVYHGLAGHFFVQDVSHVLKVRILASLEARIERVMERDDLPPKRALQVLRADDEERRRWAQHLYGIDPLDSSLYDLTIHIDKLTVDDAVELICRAVGLEQFQTTPASARRLEELTAEAAVRAALLGLRGVRDVRADGGSVEVVVEATLAESDAVRSEIDNLLRGVPEAQRVRVTTDLLPSLD